MFWRFRYPLAVLSASLYALSWSLWGELSAYLQNPHLAIGAVLLGAAMGMWVWEAVKKGAQSKFTFDLVHASIGVGLLQYFLSTYFAWKALAMLNPVIVAMGFSGLPLMTVFLSSLKKSDFLMLVAFWGLLVGASLLVAYPVVSGLPALGVFSLLAAVLSFGLGTLLVKRKYWALPGWDLCFVSMLVASMTHLWLGISENEFQSVTLNGPLIEKACLLSLLLGVLPYHYRHTVAKTGVFGARLFLYLVPALSLLFTYGQKIPFSWPSVGVLSLSLIPLVVSMGRHSLNQWMCHFSSNGTRSTDRVPCLLDGELKANGLEVQVQIINISLGGVAFRSNTRIAPGTEGAITLSGDVKTVSLHCRVAHLHYSSNQQFPWVGGLEFVQVDIQQNRVIIDLLQSMGPKKEAA